MGLLVLLLRGLGLLLSTLRLPLKCCFGLAPGLMLMLLGELISLLTSFLGLMLRLLLIKQPSQEIVLG